jgi:hypothetical protein
MRMKAADPVAPARAAQRVEVERPWSGLAHRLQAWAATPAGRVWADAAFIWAVTRLIFLALTFLVPGLLRRGGGATGGLAGLLGQWVTQDGIHYAYLAQHGYDTLWRANFWPMIPLLEHIFGPVFGGNYGLAGMVIANVSFLGALVALRRLAERELGAQAARRAALYLAIFPTAFYLFAPYSESLFLWLSISAFSAIRQRRWLLAGVLGCLSMLTRSVGLILVVPFAVEFLQAWRRGAARWWQGAFVALIPCAAGLYSAYLWLQHADPLAYEHATHTGAWARSLQWPWTALVRSVSALGPLSHTQSISGTHLLLNFVATVAILVLAIATLRLLPLSYGLYVLGIIASFLLYPVDNPALAVQGNGRYALMLFPAFMVLGVWGRRPRLHEALVLVMTSSLAILTAHFLLGLSSG